MPLGLAVVPLVYIRYRRSSASIGSQGQEPGSSAASAVNSCHQWSRPSCMDTSPPVRRSTTLCLTLGAAAMASSAIFLSATGLPRRQASSWVTRYSQPMSFIRSDNESELNPPKTTVCGAPMRVHASIATGSSGTMPM